MDFYQIKERSTKNGVIEIVPDFTICRSKDLMVRGKSFYGIWDDAKGLWSTDEYDVQRLVDTELSAYRDEVVSKTDGVVHVKLMRDYSTTSWTQFRNYLSNISDNSHQLDTKLVFANTEVKKKDYVSRRLPYPLEEGPCPAYDEIIGTLYEPADRAKLEWAIGSIVAGDSKDIQKFIVLYGEAGAGKSTIMNIVQQLFEGYYTTFDAKALTSNNNSFSTEAFRNNPLVAIQHDGDLSKIEDNTKLNSIISHEDMTVNEKHKSSYTMRINCFLFMGTNQPVKITNAKSGIIRRLIDVRTSGKKIPIKRYQTLVSQIDFELGAIASHCLNVYREMGKNYYSGYRPLDMMLQTDTFYNFIEANYYTFREQDGVSLSQAYEIYKVYCDEALIDFKLPRHKFREELKNYFDKFADMTRLEGKQVRSFYSGFLVSKFTSISTPTEEEHPYSLVLDSTKSLFDESAMDYKAQYANNKGIPHKKWEQVTTKLSDIDTSKLHYVLVPLQRIVIDLDLKDENGNKSLERNTEAASKFPPTYAEFSKSGAGIHLHYDYEGDVEKLSRVYSEGIEIKIFNVGPVGPSSLRRKLSKCNNIPVAKINSGLPLKEEKMINVDAVKSEKGLRDLVKRNLNKEIHPGTKPSIDFIHKILDDAYSSGLKYDLTDLRSKILSFAVNSSNQSEACVKIVSQMKFKSEEASLATESKEDEPIVFFDVEVFPNLLVVDWMYDRDDANVVRMINPTPQEIENLLKLKLVGFNCRRYDNHILYGRYIGYDISQIYDLSAKIIGDSKNALFGEAYNVSYTDVYDFASAANKKSLKKFEIELGIHHQELGLPWDQPIPEELWTKAADYCANDVIATRATFHHLSGDWEARKVLAELSGLTVNDTTNQHSMRILFGDNKKPQDKFIYTDLSEMFPGYKFEGGKSTYRGEETGEGGYVYAEPGVYTNVAVLDVASMHPSSIIALNMFGPYTKRFEDIKTGRISIKRNDRSILDTLLDGKLVPFVKRADEGLFKLSSLAEGLKTGLNSIYGLTSASFDNPCRDPRNKDNIVAKRGALFMIDLKHAVQEKGFTVAHIKTDSIKVPEATPEIIKFVCDFGKKYGYDFEHEATYSKFCLINDAVYIAKVKEGKHAGEWTATGAQFAQPYVFKTLFSKEPIVFEDLCETKSVTTALYLDMQDFINDVDHDYKFIGKVGSFCPIKNHCGGGFLLREKDGKYYSATGAKGYKWLEAELVKELKKEDDIDLTYYRKMVDESIKDISKYTDFEWFVSDES